MNRALPLSLVLAAAIATYFLFRSSPSGPDATTADARDPAAPAASLTADAPADALTATATSDLESATAAREPVADLRTVLHVRGSIAADPRLPLANAVVRVVQRRFAGNADLAQSPFGSSYGGILPLDRNAREFGRAEVGAGGQFEIAARGMSESDDLALVLEHDHYLLPTPVRIPAAGERTEIDVGTLRPMLGALVVGRLFGFADAARVEVRLVAEFDMMAPARDPSLFAAQLAGSMRPATHPQADGRFALRGVAPTPSAFVHAQLSGEGDSDPELDRLGKSPAFGLAPGETREVTIHAQATTTLLAEVHDADGQALAGASVRVSTTDGAFTGRATTSRHARTDGDGQARVRGIVPGGNRIEIEAYGFPNLREARELAPGSQQATFHLEAGVAVAGRVEDDLGQPIAGARIAAMPVLDVPVIGDVSGMTNPQVLAQAAANSRCVSDADGRFRLPGLRPDETVTLVAQETDHAPKTESKVRAGSEDARIVLPRLATVTGRIVDADSAAAVATFDLEVVTSMFMGMEQVVASQRARASEDGRFRLRVSPGRQSLRVTAPGYGRATTALQSEPGSEQDVGDIALAASSFIAGRVVDEAGNGVPGARVQVKRGGIMDQAIFAVMSGATTDHTTTDIDGRFRLDDVTPGRLRLRASRAGFADSDSARIEVEAGRGADDVVLTLDHGGSIAGKLLLAPGARLGDWDVYAGELRGAASPASAALAADGSFRIDDLAPGSYKVQAMNTRAFTAAMESSMLDSDRPDIGALFKGIMNKLVQGQCQVRKGETTTIELDATDLETAGHTLLVDVQVGDEPLASGLLEVRGQSEAGRLASIEAGTAEITGLPPGPVRLQVRAGLGFAALGDAQTTTVAGDAGQQRFTMRLPGGTIAGRVVDAASGEPIAGASVHARKADTIASEASEIGFALTDAAGRFRFRGLAAGTYNVVADERLSASPDRSSGRLDGLRLAAGEQREDLVLSARRGARVGVTVRDALGAPVPHAMILILDADGQPAATLPIAFTDRDGRADLAGLPDGEVRAVARVSTLAPGISELRHAATGGEIDFELTLQQGTDVALRVEDAEGKPLLGATIGVKIGDGPWLPTQLLGAVGGVEVALGALPPGAVRLRVAHPKASFEVERTIPAGRRATLTVTAPAH
ncbi:MAG: carboxypeptidase-like regulatory domain-containing protein [Planctomycetota bacterium]